jgi:glycosyltransferase involved in cell wall biosynthesis
MSIRPLSVLVCGNYGYRTCQIDGQTIKTRVLKEAFVEAMGEAHVREADSSTVSRFPIRFLCEVRKGFMECSQVVMLPGRRGLQMFLPLFLHWKRKWNRPLQYVVIGGWLPDLLGKKAWLRHRCAQLDGIYVETTAMAEALSGLGLRNVRVLPNFRKFNRNLKREYAPTVTPLKLVFYSRVIREKGVEEAIAAVQRLNATYGTEPRAVLDVYGPVPDCYRLELQRLLLQSQHVYYRGVLAPGNACDTLQAYDLMLFPTYYEGEGFPGALVDACISGLPVIASDWKYNRGIVKEGRTGVLARVHSVEDLVAHMETFIAYPARILAMRQHCLEEAKHYHVEQAVERLLGITSTEEPPPGTCQSVL